MEANIVKHKCAYLGCQKEGELLDDVETAPNVIEKKMVCRQHQGQLTKHIFRTTNSRYMFSM